MSYNVLADSLARQYRAELYRGKDEDLMRWPQRLAGILAEVGLCTLNQVDP
jgi:mRNA deadenylase 3'-5' endonuclease subunit Ccr4